MHKFTASAIVSTVLLAAACSSGALPDTVVMSPESAALAKGGPTTHTVYDGGSGDGGSCGNTWANDTYRLDIKVTPNGNGTYGMQVEYKEGKFTTIAGQSPGACGTTDPHEGTTVADGILGKLEGKLNETITSATFNSNACSTAGSCATRTDFIVQAFGCSGACESDFTYDFKYQSNDKGLVFHHWRDRSTGGPDMFTGDIASN